MKYMGSKRKYKKDILPIILKDRGDRVYVEPFVGGGNIIENVPQGRGRIGGDNFLPVIKALNVIQNNTELIPNNNTEYTKQ